VRGGFTHGRLVRMTVPLWSWFAAVGFIAALLAVDFATGRRRRDPDTRFRSAVIASAAWITVSIVFGVVLGLTLGSDTAEQYFAGYIVEKSLSVDNIFVFALLFRAFAVPDALQHRVLFYGVFGALALRAGFIAAGATLLDHFSWIFYLFGAFLVVGGLRMLRGETEVDPGRNVVVRALSRVVPVTPEYEGERFLTRVDGRRHATPLLIALIAIETTDIVFATDSIPAIFGITRNVFVIFTSNAFAVLGLRALYFVFAQAMDRFVYLRYGLAALLAFIGVKMLIAPIVHISVITSLAVIVVILGSSILVSWWHERRAGSGPPANEDDIRP
jgi:tellurite resistance protein TerC